VAAATTAGGERSIAAGYVGRDAVTGDGNIVINVNALTDAQLDRLLPRAARRKTLRPVPLRAAPGRPPRHVDRDGDARDALADPEPANLHGPAGIGKTHVLLHALAQAGDEEPDRACVYVRAPDTQVEDVLQALFEAFYECVPPLRPTDAELLEDLRSVDAVIAIDARELERDAVQTLVLALPKCRVLVATRSNAFVARSILVRGFALRDAIALVEQELGHRLEGTDLLAAEALCRAYEGHPLHIREAVAQAREEGQRIQDVVPPEALDGPSATLSRVDEHSRELVSPAATARVIHRLAQPKAASLKEPQKAALTVCAALSEIPVGVEHVVAISGRRDAAAALEASARRYDVASQSPRFSLIGALVGDPPPEWDLEATRRRALAHYVTWAEAHGHDPVGVVKEAAAIRFLLDWALGASEHRSAVRLGRAVAGGDGGSPVGGMGSRRGDRRACGAGLQRRWRARLDPASAGNSRRLPRSLRAGCREASRSTSAARQARRLKWRRIHAPQPRGADPAGALGEDPSAFR
jgi:hypothetical protein